MLQHGHEAQEKRLGDVGLQGDVETEQVEDEQGLGELEF
jgi:hypothetical protein